MCNEHELGLRRQTCGESQGRQVYPTGSRALVAFLGQFWSLSHRLIHPITTVASWICEHRPKRCPYRHGLRERLGHLLAASTLASIGRPPRPW